MNLIETYVYEVTRRLPEKTRGDIALELTIDHRGYADRKFY